MWLVAVSSQCVWVVLLQWGLQKDISWISSHHHIQTFSQLAWEIAGSVLNLNLNNVDQDQTTPTVQAAIWRLYTTPYLELQW